MRRLALVSGRREVATACRMGQVGITGWSPLSLQAHLFLSLRCPSSSPVDVLPTPAPLSPHPRLTWMSRSCFMSSGGSCMETPGAETEDAARTSFHPYLLRGRAPGWGGRVPVPHIRVPLIYGELIEQHSSFESMTRYLTAA